MATKIISFNGVDYEIDESSLSDSIAELREYFSTTMSGSGATINFGEVTYNVDSTKLTTTMNDFVSHLGTIAGNGTKVIINGVEYAIDSTKVASAVSELEIVLRGLESGAMPDEPEESAAVPCLTFSSPSEFTVGVVDNTKYWDGTLEYSTDTKNWNTWDGTTAISSSTDGKLYMRGTGNTKITGSSAGSSKAKWVLTGNDISCVGNIETLLDYQTVANGEHPIMTEKCYHCMFSGCTNLTTAPELPATTLAKYCYHSMFKGAGLTTAPELPATTLEWGCYSDMFEDCTNLTTTPKLPATTLAGHCYSYMFSGCTNLITLPKLPAITLVSNCYSDMFKDCTKIKISTTKTGEYQTSYRIPVSGTGTTATDALSFMLYNTGGTYTVAPKINTTYYTSNEVV